MANLQKGRKFRRERERSTLRNRKPVKGFFLLRDFFTLLFAGSVALGAGLTIWFLEPQYQLRCERQTAAAAADGIDCEFRRHLAWLVTLQRETLQDVREVVLEPVAETYLHRGSLRTRKYEMLILRDAQKAQINAGARRVLVDAAEPLRQLLAGNGEARVDIATWLGWGVLLFSFVFSLTGCALLLRCLGLLAGYRLRR